MNLISILHGTFTAWYNFVVVALLTPIGFYVLYRIFIRYKIIRMGDNKIQVDYPVMRQSKKYTLSDLEWWVENKVKTGKNSEYKELQFKFTDGKKIDIGQKEHTEYARMLQYLAQKAPKKKAVLR
jgi:hypothetical protein